VQIAVEVKLEDRLVAGMDYCTVVYLVVTSVERRMGLGKHFVLDSDILAADIPDSDSLVADSPDSNSFRNFKQSSLSTTSTS